MRQWGWIALAGLAAIVLVIPLRAEETNPLIGKAAPAFSLITTSGSTVALSDLKGKVILLDFWATWCGPCQASMPHLQELTNDKTLADKGLIVLVVNDAEDKATIEHFVKENKLSLTIPMDSNEEAMKSYHVDGLPVTLVIGRDGTVANAFSGYTEEIGTQIDAAIKAALAK